MGFQDFIADSEAAHLVGVSVATLNRFCEAGYLNAESDSDGLRLFSKAELAKVFSVDLPGTSVVANDTRSPVLHKSEQPSEVAAVAPVESAEPPPTTETESPIEAKSLESINPEVRDQAQLAPSRESVDSMLSMERELARFKQLVHMQERLLEVQDDQLREVRRDRDWLRTRIERLEDKQERDQLLLLSETQTIRKLVSNQEQKKSSLQYALEWFGLASTSQPGSINKNQIGRTRLASTIEATHTPKNAAVSDAVVAPQPSDLKSASN